MPNTETSKEGKIICDWCKCEYLHSDISMVFDKGSWNKKKYCSLKCNRLHHRSINAEKYFDQAIPKRYRNATFENYKSKDPKNQNIIAWLMALGDDFTDNIFIYGNPGCGKTHIAYSIFKMVKNSTKVYKIEKTSNMLLEIRKTFSDSSDKNEDDVIQEYCKPDVLIIDDIGAEKVTDYSLQCLYNIIDTRYNEMKPTIFTSNLSIADISKAYNDRLASRIASGKVYNLSGDDYRLKKC